MIPGQSQLNYGCNLYCTAVYRESLTRCTLEVFGYSAQAAPSDKSEVQHSLGWEHLMLSGLAELNTAIKHVTVGLTLRSPAMTYMYKILNTCSDTS